MKSPDPEIPGGGLLERVEEFLEKYGPILRDLPADMMLMAAAMDESLMNGTVYRADLVEILRPVNELIFGIVMAVDSEERQLWGIEEVVDESLKFAALRDDFS